MSPIPIGNPEAALRITTAYDLKGKVGLQHDEIVVPVTIVDDVSPPPPAMEFERVDVTAVAGATASANGTGPAEGFVRRLKHVCITVRFGTNSAAGDHAVARAQLDNPVNNVTLHGVFLLGGGVTDQNMELASGLGLDLTIPHIAGSSFLSVLADAQGSAVSVGARLSYSFIDEAL